MEMEEEKILIEKSVLDIHLLYEKINPFGKI